MSGLFAAFLHSPIVAGAISGFIGAAAVDYHIFMTWKSPSDMKEFDFKIAGFRWLQGTIGGAITAAGIAGLK